MKAALALGVALALAGCGGASIDQTAGAGGGTSGTGTTGATGGATSTGGTGGAAPSGVLCSEVAHPASSCTPDNYHEPLVSFVAGSSLVFRGTVTALHATTPGIGITDTSRTIVVHVTSVLFDGGMLSLTGKDVTVELLAAPTMAVGYDGYFFTQIWTLGQSVGVTEVAHVDPGVFPTVDTDVPGILALLADERLYARMQTAAAVLAVTVTSVTQIPVMPGSEHDPLWAEATLAADCALRGATLLTARVAFATSNDVAWYQSPKLTAGQQGIFLLQPAPSPPGVFPIPDGIPYVVTSPLDVHPTTDRARIATLVLCPPGE